MEVNFLEAVPGTEHQRHPTGSPALAVKRYARPAAGRALPLPAEVRPIGVLERTTDHLIALTDNAFSGTYAFIADRLRAVVQDLVVQAINDERAALIYERIIRFHALSAVRYAEEPAPSYSAYHNHELLSKALVSLMHIYATVPPRDEAAELARSEFHGYQLLLHAAEPMLSLSHARTLSARLLASAPVERALRLLHALSARDGLLVLRLARSLPPTAVGCLLHLVPAAREAAAGALRRAYLKQEALPARWVCELLLLPADSDALLAAIGPLGFALDAAAAPLAAGAPPPAALPVPLPAASARSLRIDRAVVRVLPPAEAPKPAAKGAQGQDALSVLTPALAAWRAAGARVAAIVGSGGVAWPAPRARQGASTAAGLAPTCAGPAGASAPAGAPAAGEGEGEGEGDAELLGMLELLRLQINKHVSTSPDFLRAAPAQPATDTAGREGAPVDDELAQALKDAIASMGAPAGGTPGGAA